MIQSEQNYQSEYILYTNFDLKKPISFLNTLQLT
jgi:hypothetical protein